MTWSQYIQSFDISFLAPVTQLIPPLPQKCTLQLFGTVIVDGEAANGGG